MDQQNLDFREADAFAWRYGLVGLAGLVEGRSMDEAEVGSAASGGVRLRTDVDMTLRCALGGIAAIRSLLGIGRTTLASWLAQSGDPASRKRWMQLWDNLLVQIADVSRQSGVGDVNLLHSSIGALRIPYFNVSVLAEGEEFHFFTLGIGIHRIIGSETDPDALQGLIAISPREGHGICWLEALEPWAAELEIEIDFEAAACEQQKILNARMDQLEDTLCFLAAQLRTFWDCFDDCTRVILS